MKIMLVDVYKIVNYAGGIEKVLCEFANHFSQRGDEVVITCLDTEKGRPLYLLNDKVKFVNLCFKYGQQYNRGLKYYLVKFEKEFLRAFGGKKLQWRGTIRNDPKKKYFYDTFRERLKKCLEKEKPDVVLGASPDASMLVYQAVNLSDRLNPIQIGMCHVDARYCVKHMLSEELDVWKAIDAVQVLMPSFIKSVQQAGIKRVVCIPNNVKQLSADERVDSSLPHHNIISIGRFEKDVKRPHLIVEAFCKIADQFPKWSLVMYGDISNKKYIKEIQKKIKDNKLQNRIFLNGPTTKVYDVLRKSDIFVTASASEGVGLAVTEAMSVGLPVVAYKGAGALDDLIENGINGYLCEDDNTFVEKLAILLDNEKQRLFMGEKAIKSIKRYDSNIIWNKWAQLLEHLIRTKRR